MEPKVKVGENIRVRRMRLGITQEALGYRCGMHPVEVGRAERGLRDLRISTVAKLARGLEVPACELPRGSARTSCCCAAVSAGESASEDLKSERER